MYYCNYNVGSPYPLYNQHFAFNFYSNIYPKSLNYINSCPGVPPVPEGDPDYPSSCPSNIDLAMYIGAWIYIWPKTNTKPFWIYLTGVGYDPTDRKYKVRGCAYLCLFSACDYQPGYEFNIEDIKCYGI